MQREDIRFGDGEAGTVWLDVEVHNTGSARSKATGMSVGVAPFGAFVESEPVGVLEVPSVPAGGSRVVSARFRRRPDEGLEPVGDVGRWRKRAAGNAAWRASQERYSLQVMQMEFMRDIQSLQGGTGTSTTSWAGNFDVHIGESAAERHCSSAVKLEAGKRNWAVFVVGRGPGTFRFDFLGDGRAWGPALWTPGSNLAPQKWVGLAGESPVILRVAPPEGTTEGLLAVSVEQRSSGKCALVEFGFGVDCIPPRCFRSPG